MDQEQSKVGRPLIELPQDQFESLCKLIPTLPEAAGFFKVSEDTIERWCVRTYGVNFAEVLKRFSAETRVSLRRKQLSKALEDGDRTLLIWLGKQLLGQKEKIEHSGDKENPLVGRPDTSLLSDAEKAAMLKQLKDDI